MTCPHCGAYSPKNTSICNRCGRRLPLLEAQRQNQQEHFASPSYTLPEHSGYGYGYRQPEPTKLGLFLEKVGTFLDENLLENPTVKKAVIAGAGVLLVLIVLLSVCCGSCGGKQSAVSSTDVSYTDVSATDTSSSDISGSVVSAADTSAQS